MKQESYSQAVGRYLIGAIGATTLTLLAYLSVTQHWTSNMTLLAAIIMFFAVIQFGVQIYFFLHFGADKKPQWRTYSLLFTILTLLIVVIGSLWIMMNLNYRMNMGPNNMNQYMIDQNKKGF